MGGEPREKPILGYGELPSTLGEWRVLSSDSSRSFAFSGPKLSSARGLADALVTVEVIVNRKREKALELEDAVAPHRFHFIPIIL